MHDNVSKALKGISDTAETLGKINEIAKFDGVASKTSQFKKLEEILKGVDKQQSLLAISTSNLSEADKKSIAIKLGLITAEEANVVATKGDTLAKLENLSVTNMLKVAWAKLSAFAMANPWLVGITAAVAGLTALYMAVEHFTTTIDEAREKTEEAYNELQSITSEVETLESKIKELNNQINELDPITNADDIKNLETETALLEAQLAILKEKERLAKEEANKAAEESMGKTVASKYSSTGIDTPGMMIAGEYVQGTSAIPEYVTEIEELNLAIDAYEEAQSKMKSLREEQARLEEEFGKNSDEYLANANEISALDEEITSMETHMVSLADSIETQSRALDGSTDKSKELQAESENTLNRYTDLINATNGYTDALNENSEAKQENVNNTEIIFSDAFNTESLSAVSEEIDKIQNAYKTLNDAIDEYNQTGSFSIDTLQSVIALGDDWLDYLVDENGNLQLDKESLEQLTQARLNDMRVQIINNMIDNVSKIETDAQANDYLKSTNYELAESYDAVTASALASARAKLEDAVASGTLSQANMDASMSKLTNDIVKINKLFKNADFSTSSMSGGSSSSSTKDATQDFKKLLDAHLNLYEAELDAGIISFDDFLSKSRSMLDQYYREGKISSADYWSYVENLYEKQLDIYKRVLSAVTRRIDKEIDGIKDIIEGIEKQNDAINKQKDEYDGVLSIVEDVYDKKIESIKAEQDAIQDTIDKLQEENDEKQRQIDLEKARYQLYQLLNNRSVKLYNGQEFVYTTNRDEIRDGQQNLADLELEETISGLEKEQESLDESIELLEQYRNMWAEISNAHEIETNKALAIALWGKNYEEMILSNRISDIESFKNNYVSIQKQIENNQGLIDSYNEKVTYYENLKSKWQDITDAYKNAQEDMLASQVLGANWEADILSGRLSTINTFKDNYIATQQAMANASVLAHNATIEAINGEIAALKALNDAKNNVTYTPTEKVPNAFMFDSTTGKTTNLTKVNAQNSKYNLAAKKLTDKTIYSYKYGSGTNNAKQGIHQVSENGDEIILDNHNNAILAKGKQLHLFEGGETVIKSSETTELLRNQGNLVPLETLFPNIDTSKFMENMPNITPNVNIPKYDFTTMNHNAGTTISIGDIHLHKMQNVDSFANAIVREFPNKVIQAINKR